MCEKHKERKRPNTCPDCKAELDNQGTVAETPVQEDTQIEIVNIDPPVTEQQGRVYDSKVIRVMIESEIVKAISKVRSEMSDLMNIRWEHLLVPYAMFSLQLLYILEKENWKYCELIKNARQFGYSADGEFFLLQRVVRKGNQSMPDFTKQGTLKKYLEKNNE